MVRIILLVLAGGLVVSLAGAQQSNVFSENNDGTTNQLTASAGTGPGGWTLQSNSAVAHSGSGYWTSDDPSQISDYYLTTPTLTYTSAYTGPLSLSFWHQFDFESGFDGGVVEVSVNGGAFGDIGPSSFTLNGYNGSIDPNFSSPIAGRQAFTGTSPGFTPTGKTGWINSAAHISGLTAGNTFQVRFRSTSDASLGATGWYVDDVNITATTVPEPASIAMFGVGLAAFLRRRRAKKVS